MAHKTIPHLMFYGTAERAMNFYISLFKNAEILSSEKYRAGETGAEGTIKAATFQLNGQEFICIDSPAVHDFGFTPAISIYVECESEAELDRVFGQLSANGKVFMPLADYGFSQKFGWTNDRFGVSWQLNLL